MYSFLKKSIHDQDANQWQEKQNGLKRLPISGRHPPPTSARISDEAAAKLMSQLFKVSNANPKLSHGEALRRAVLGTLSSANSDEETHPRLWAPFVVVGEPRQITVSKTEAPSSGKSSTRAHAAQ